MQRLSVVVAVVSAIAFIPNAFAADLPVKAPPVPVVASYNWNGFYIGANIGGGWGNRSVDYLPNDPASAALFRPAAGGAPPSISFDTSGALGGLQLGYNWQFNRNWLIGIETDFDWLGMKGSGSSTNSVNGVDPIAATVDEHVKWFGTTRARLGYLPTNRLLTYVTGGLAYGKVEHSGFYTQGGAGFNSTLSGFSVLCGGTTCFSGASSSTAVGWTLGGGLEYAVWQNWTVKAEYLYVSLNGKSVTETALAFTAGNLPASFNANYNRTNFNVARVGINYRF